MRTWVVIMGVLAVAAMVYGFDAGALKTFHDNFIQCNEEAGESPSEPRVETIKCAIIKDGKILNSNGEYVKEVALERIGDLISDAGKLEQAYAKFNTCYNEAVDSGATGDEQTMKIITCSMSILGLVDKIE